jgi:hypothetical protein
MKKVKKPTLKQDMKKLAKEIHEISKRHGHIYISAAQCEGASCSWVTFGATLETIYHEPKTSLKGEPNE